jgi:hypothetical protein
MQPCMHNTEGCTTHAEHKYKIYRVRSITSCVLCCICVVQLCYAPITTLILNYSFLSFSDSILHSGISTFHLNVFILFVYCTTLAYFLHNLRYIGNILCMWISSCMNSINIFLGCIKVVHLNYAKIILFFSF